MHSCFSSGKLHCRFFKYLRNNIYWKISPSTTTSMKVVSPSKAVRSKSPPTVILFNSNGTPIVPPVIVKVPLTVAFSNSSRFSMLTVTSPLKIFPEKSSSSIVPPGNSSSGSGSPFPTYTALLFFSRISAWAYTVQATFIAYGVPSIACLFTYSRY